VDKILTFAVLNQLLLQQQKTEASFVYVIVAVLLVKIITKSF